MADLVPFGLDLSTGEFRRLEITDNLSFAGGRDATARRLSVDTTTVGNVGAGEDDLMSFTIQSGVMANNGDAIEVEAWGDLGTAGGDFTIRAYVDGTVKETATRVVGTNELTWRSNLRIVRLSSTSLEVLASIIIDGDSVFQTRSTEAVADLASNSFIIKYTGEDDSATTDEIQQYAMLVDYIPDNTL